MSKVLDTLQLLVNELHAEINPNALFLHGEFSAAMSESLSLDYWTPYRNRFDEFTNKNQRVLESVSGTWPTVLIRPGKAKEETLLLFAQAAACVEDGGWVLAAMENDIGAARFEKSFKELFGEVVTISKNKCRGFAAKKTSAFNEAKARLWLKFGEPQLIENGRFTTTPGIFSAGAIDGGSAILAQHMPKSLRGCVADVGAGWGFLSAEILKSHGKLRELHLFEVDQRSLDCARKNITSESVELHFHWCDATKGLGQVFDAIVMNPPFHQGRQMSVGLGKHFISAAAAGLKPQGELWMVANRQLPYEEQLDAVGLRGRIIYEDARYKVIYARKVSRI